MCRSICTRVDKPDGIRAGRGDYGRSGFAAHEAYIHPGLSEERTLAGSASDTQVCTGFQVGGPAPCATGRSNDSIVSEARHLDYRHSLSRAHEYWTSALGISLTTRQAFVDMAGAIDVREEHVSPWRSERRSGRQASASKLV
jgi:hypothetical protein